MTRPLPQAETVSRFARLRSGRVSLGLTATGLRQCLRWPMLVCIGVVGCDAELHSCRASLRACLGCHWTVVWTGARRLHHRPGLFARTGAGADRIQRDSRAGRSPIRATTSIAAIGGRSIRIAASIRSCRRSRFPIRRSRPRPRPMKRRAPSSGRRKSSLFPTATAGYNVTRTRTGSLAGGGSTGGSSGLGDARTTLFDAVHRADQRHLGSRRLGQDAPANREQYRGRAGERRRSRQRQALGAGRACHRLFQSARRGFADRSADPHDRGIQKRTTRS